MKNVRTTDIISTGLAIFSMLFGAGNLIYPLVVGLNAGTNVHIGMFGFIITAIVIPVIGLVAMILFNGNYEVFFHRLGKPIGNLLILLSMAIIGPLLVIPRIVTLSHTMTAPFLPGFLQTITPLSSCIFAFIFLGITFLATYRENKIVDLLGYFISPALLISLTIIMIKGFWSAQKIVPSDDTPWVIFKRNFIRGYETLDLFGTLFFASIILVILKKSLGEDTDKKTLARVGLQAGVIGVSLLGLVYTGMSLLSLYHGHGLHDINAGELFREVSIAVMGNGGALIIATAVLMACLSTAIGLSAVVGEYVQHNIFKNTIEYIPALIITLATCIPLSTFGLGYVLQLTGGPITYVGYPILIALTFCNIAYKLFGFKPVKIPVLATFIFALISYLW